MNSSRFSTLTPRERDCLRLVYQRRKTKEIAKELGLQPGTVYRYLNDAQRKLGAADRRQAAEWLHDANTSTAPIELGGRSDWIAPLLADAPPVGHGMRTDWHRMLPFRMDGARHNDLGSLARLFWIFFGAVALAIGFGMLAVGANVVSNFFGRG